MPQIIKYILLFTFFMAGQNSVLVSGQEFVMSSVQARCYSEKSGIIQVNQIKGKSPYIIVLSADSLRKSEIKRSTLLKEDHYLLKEISAGKYYISIICADGQISTQIAMIEQPPQLVPGKISVESYPSSQTALDGVIIAHPNGGTPPYSFSWQGNSVKGTNSKISDVGKGIFKCNIIDSHGCGPVSATIFLNTKPASKPTSSLQYLRKNNIVERTGQLLFS
jgi:hypothetical protein